ncbi:MAG: CheR family methyltransferase, partial [bacterium]
RKADAGVYSEWSFRQTPAWIKERYFRKTDTNKFEILPRIKSMVDFEYLNLAEDIYPSFLINLYAVDVVFCRNVLMYFEPEQAQKVLSRFHRSLVDDGWLVVGASDLLHVRTSEFKPVSLQSLNVWKKDLMGVLPIQKSIGDDTASHLEHPKRFEPPQQPEIHFTLQNRDVVSPLPATGSLSDGRDEKEARLEQPPQDDGIYQKAMGLYQDGHYEGAGEMLLKHLSSGPEAVNGSRRNAKEIALLARVFANQGHLAEALAWCDKAVAVDNLIPASYYLRASILQEQGNSEQAAGSLRQALFLDPDFVLAHFMQGHLAHLQGKAAESRKHLSNALRLLDRLPKNEILPESEGITADRLRLIITSMM